MRPLAISMQGFLSYRDPTVLDLSGIRAAAILGPNGAGKTSLVEAITWALWGSGRFRSPDDYVSAGATECRVAVDFEISGATYRVIRQRHIGATSRSELTLLATDEPADPDGFGWQPVGGATIAETQAAILDVVGMDAGTWEATSYIAQGKADAFTQLTPAKRKELLSEVLDLGRYEALAERAKERERMAAGDVIRLEQRLERLQAAVTNEAVARGQLDQAVSAQAEAEAKVGVHVLDVEGAERAHTAAQEALAGLQAARARLTELRERRERALADRDAQLSQAVRNLAEHEQATVTLETRVTKLRLSERLIDTLSSEADRLAEEASALVAQADTHERRRMTDRETAAIAQAEIGQLEGETSQVRDRIKLLTRTHEPTCFVCAQDLPAELRDKIVDQLLGEEKAYVEQLPKLRAISAEHTEAARTLERQAAASRERAEALGTQATATRDRLNLARHDVAEIPDAAAQLERMRGHQLGLVGEVTERTAAVADGHREFETDEQALLADLAGVTEAEDAERAAALRLTGAKDGLEDVRNSWYRCGVVVGAAQESVAQHEGSKAELHKAATDLDATRLLRLRWHQIALMFSRDGIPALIIENAVPEIESHANLWLDRLAKGRLSVRIDSLRANKGGGIRETLDITVADGEDERPLEGFSGGERQRVNLALRLALAEMLARRAGHPIETLILDEAFTAMDAEGRQLAIEVIRALEDTFPTTLFVSHLVDLAEQFPTQIVVSRGEDGASTISVEQVA